jgi:hypothetical protein
MEILGLILCGECTIIGSKPFVISGLATSGVVVPNLTLNSAIILSGICGLVSCKRSHCSRTIFNISFAEIRSSLGRANSIRINL